MMFNSKSSRVWMDKRRASRTREWLPQDMPSSCTQALETDDFEGALPRGTASPTVEPHNTETCAGLVAQSISTAIFQGSQQALLQGSLTETMRSPHEGPAPGTQRGAATLSQRRPELARDRIQKWITSVNTPSSGPPVLETITKPPTLVNRTIPKVTVPNATTTVGRYELVDGLCLPGKVQPPRVEIGACMHSGRLNGVSLISLGREVGTRFCDGILDGPKDSVKHKKRLSTKRVRTVKGGKAEQSSSKEPVEQPTPAKTKLEGILAQLQDNPSKGKKIPAKIEDVNRQAHESLELSWPQTIFLDQKPKAMTPRPGKKGANSWNGEITSNSRWRRLTAKGQVDSANDCDSEYPGVSAHGKTSVNSSDQQPPYLSALYRNHQSQHLPPTSPHRKEEFLQTNSALSNENMSIKGAVRGLPPSNRGRSYGRTSNNQTSPDIVEPVFHCSPAPSVAGGRRPRGFQPSEVNRPKSTHSPVNTDPSKQASAHGGTHTTNDAATKAPNSQPTTSTEAHTPPKGLTSSHQTQHINHTPPPPEPPILIQTTTLVTSRPKLNILDIEADSNSDQSRFSSVDIIIHEDNPECQLSCWSKVAPAKTATTGWDSGTQDLSRPAWMLRDAVMSTLPNAPKRANLAKLPEYKFPRRKELSAVSSSGNRQVQIQTPITAPPISTYKTSRETEQDTASSSFDRQVASIARRGISPGGPDKMDKSLPQQITSQVPGSSHAQNLPQVLAPAKVESTNVKETEAFEQPSVKHQAEHSSGPVHKDFFIPPHLRAPSSPPETPNDKEGKRGKDNQHLPPHLRKLDTRLETTAQNESGDGYSVKGNMKIAEMKGYTVPTGFQGRPPPKSRATEKSILSTLTSSQHHQAEVEPQAALDFDEEIAAGSNAVNRDEELAAALQVELTLEEDNTHSLQPAHLQQPNQQLDQQKSIPPHLRASAIKAPKPEPKPKILSMPRKSEVAQPSKTQSITADCTPFNVLSDVTKARQNSTVGLSSKSKGLANGAESKVKAAKDPAKNGKFVNNESGLTDWNGNLMPPPVGDDWDTRQHYDPTFRERHSVIEAWRIGQAADLEVQGISLDTASPGFQNGDGLAGGAENMLSPINDADHEIIPNDDDFTVARRDQNAIDAIKAFKARSAANHPSLKSDKAPAKRKEQKRLPKEQDDSRAISPNRHEPEANIYLRPAEFHDMRQCTEIYNHYVRETYTTCDLTPVVEIEFRDYLQTAHDQGDPFIVAIHMGQKRNNDRRTVHRKKQEIVVGFAYAKDYSDQKSIYRYAVELELYVHPGHLRQGIGRTMLDRMLSALDPGYNLLEYAPLIGSYEPSHWVGGGHCICKTILVNIIHSEGKDKADMEWKKKWLSKERFNFQHTGSLPKIGNKGNTPLSICQMVLETLSTLQTP